MIAQNHRPVSDASIWHVAYTHQSVRRAISTEAR
jgi:hypothetical protein